MFNLIILTVLITNISARLANFPDLDRQNDVDPNIEPIDYENEFNFLDGDPLWVLSLSDNEWIAPKMRLGDAEEAEDFFYHVQPLINSRKRKAATAKKDVIPKRPNATEDAQKSNTELKRDIMQIINKLALSRSLAPDSFITDNNYDTSPSIALYFKGSYTSLVIKLEQNQWHYVINMKGALPGWFFEEHDTRDSPIDVPEDVRNKLFSSLYRLVKSLFGHPI